MKNITKVCLGLLPRNLKILKNLLWIIWDQNLNITPMCEWMLRTSWNIISITYKVKFTELNLKYPESEEPRFDV